MNILQILNLKPGTLFRGINNSRRFKSILSTDGWDNPECGSYGIRWYEDIMIDKLKFNIFNHRNTTFENRLSVFNQYPPFLRDNLKIYDNENHFFELKKLQIGKPIGMFLGESIFCTNGATYGIVLLKILDTTKIGWIVLGCKNMHLPAEPFEIY